MSTDKNNNNNNNKVYSSSADVSLMFIQDREQILWDKWWAHSALQDRSEIMQNNFKKVVGALACKMSLINIARLVT